MTAKNKGPKVGGSPREVAALDELERITREERRQLDEAAFLRHYLPLFASRDENVDMTPWLEVAGNVYMPVSIMRDGKEIYQIPPLIRTVNTSVARQRGRISMYEVMETAERKNLINPNLGRAYLDAELRGRVSAVETKPEEVLFWNKLFVENGYPPLLSAELEAEIDGKQLTDGDLFDDGFEEL